MTVLSVNVNKIAWLRNARLGSTPDVLEMARVCVEAGAGGITVHPRPDERHIRASDVRVLARELDVELNIEGNPFSEPRGAYPGYLALVRETRPVQATLVPDSIDQLTSDHGWDVAAAHDRLSPVISELHDLGCRVSLFMDADAGQWSLARDLGADRVELYTEAYAKAHAAAAAGGQTSAGAAHEGVLEGYSAAARAAQAVGLGVNAGHDLNLANLTDFLSAVPGVLEVSIGHALIADALRYGLADTVRRYLAAVAAAHPPPQER